MKNLLSVVAVLLWIAMSANSAHAHGSGGSSYSGPKVSVTKLVRDMNDGIAQKDWLKVSQIVLQIERSGKQMPVNGLYALGQAFFDQNQLAGAVVYFDEYMSKAKPSDQNYQNVALNLRQAKQSLPAYCQQNAKACAQMGARSWYKTKDNGDPQIAFLLFSNSCNGGFINSCNNLAHMYSIGAGVEKDDAKAIALYQKSCDGDVTSACESLGEIYQHGKGVSPDLETAIKFYQKDCQLKTAGGCEQLKALGVKYSHKARPIRRYPPIYPLRAASKGLQGECKLTFDVTIKGKTQNIRAKCSDRVFKKQARASVKKWEYEPQIIDGVAVKASNVASTVKFNLPK